MFYYITLKPVFTKLRENLQCNFKIVIIIYHIFKRRRTRTRVYINSIFIIRFYRKLCMILYGMI